MRRATPGRATRSAIAPPTASRRARPRRHDLRRARSRRCARSGRSRRRRDALRTQPRAHARVLNARGARNADTRESGGYRVRGGRQSSARGRRDPKERREIPENAGWSTPLTFRGVCSGNTHLVSGAWPAFGCAPVVAIVSVLVSVIRSDGATLVDRERLWSAVTGRRVSRDAVQWEVLTFPRVFPRRRFARRLVSRSRRSRISG